MFISKFISSLFILLFPVVWGNNEVNHKLITFNNTQESLFFGNISIRSFFEEFQALKQYVTDLETDFNTLDATVRRQDKEIVQLRANLTQVEALALQPDELFHHWRTELCDDSVNGITCNTVYDATVVEFEYVVEVTIPLGTTIGILQGFIDNIPQFLPRYVQIKLLFASGTYTFDEVLDINGFTGHGTITFYGNENEADANTAHTTQEVVLDFSLVDSSKFKGYDPAYIAIGGNTPATFIEFTYIRFDFSIGDAATEYGMYVRGTNVNIVYCSVTSSSMGANGLNGYFLVVASGRLSVGYTDVTLPGTKTSFAWVNGLTSYIYAYYIEGSVKDYYLIMKRGALAYSKPAQRIMTATNGIFTDISNSNIPNGNVWEYN